MQQTLKHESYRSATWYAPRRKRAAYSWVVDRHETRTAHLNRTGQIVYRRDDCDWKEIPFAPRIEKVLKHFLVEVKFQTLAEEWKRESRFASTGNQFVLPSYQKIIGLGPNAVPAILRDLQKETNHWFWALAALTGENPVPPQSVGNVKAMRQAWIDWGKQHGHL